MSNLMSIRIGFMIFNGYVIHKKRASNLFIKIELNDETNLWGILGIFAILRIKLMLHCMTSDP